MIFGETISFFCWKVALKEPLPTLKKLFFRNPYVATNPVDVLLSLWVLCNLLLVSFIRFLLPWHLLLIYMICITREQLAKNCSKLVKTFLLKSFVRKSLVVQLFSANGSFK